MILIAQKHKTRRRSVAALALFGLLSVAAPAQQSTPPPAAKSAMTPEQARRAQLRADIERLDKLTEELKAEVAKTNKDTLSITVIKKAEEIEKLARSLKERMRAER